MQILRRDHFECQECRRRIEQAAANGTQLSPHDRQIRRAEHVHHIKDLEHYPNLKLDDDNLISVCHECHDRIHGRLIEEIKTNRKKPLTEERW